jgi:hypothetical protein
MEQDFTFDELRSIYDALVEKRASLVNNPNTLMDRNLRTKELENIEKVIGRVMDFWVQKGI